MFMNKLSFDHVGLTVWKLITIDRRLLITVHLSFVNGTQGCDAQNDNIYSSAVVVIIVILQKCSSLNLL